MSNKQQEVRVYTGPNLTCPHAALVTDYSSQIFGGDLTLSKAELEKLYRIVPNSIVGLIDLRSIIEGESYEDANALLVRLTNALLDIKATQNITIKVRALDNGNFQLILDYKIEAHAALAMQIAFLWVSFTKSSFTDPPQALKGQSEYLIGRLAQVMPGGVISDMLKVARKRSIPYYPVGSGPLEFSYGQGRKGIVYNYASNDRDSNFGFYMSKDKVATNAYLKKLGIPTTTIMQVQNFDACHHFIKQVGYPVVLKPLSGSQGQGVSLNIQSEEEAVTAYDKAASQVDGKVVIEQFLTGDVYRITVSQHKPNTVYEMIPARLIGDGKSSVNELIKRENIARIDERAKGNKYIDLTLDEAALKELEKDGFNPDSVPDEGQKVYLRRVSNAASGGTYELIDYDNVHPDVLDLATDITRIFRLDNVGLDYITHDISKSWRDGNGAIIEVNAFPTIEELLAEQVFENHFGPDGQGRIETLLIVTDDDILSDDIYVKGQKECRNSGFVSAHRALYRDNKLALGPSSTYAKCLALLLNPTCEKLVVALSGVEIIEYGLPIDYFDNCLLDKDVNVDEIVAQQTGKPNLKAWLNDHVGQVDFIN